MIAIYIINKKVCETSSPDNAVDVYNYWKREGYCPTIICDDPYDNEYIWSRL